MSTTPTARARDRVVKEILGLDSRLLVAGERLARYRASGTADSVIVQRGVVNRLLDERLVLMAERDRG
jgi:hypothetical protein